jgi:D-xylono/L-arabinono-1,4-lactonase
MEFPPPSLIAPTSCRLGESPLWDAERRMLFWTDIDGGELHAWRETSGSSNCIYRDESVGGLTLEADGALALFRKNTSPALT